MLSEGARGTTIYSDKWTAKWKDEHSIKAILAASSRKRFAASSLVGRPRGESKWVLAWWQIRLGGMRVRTTDDRYVHGFMLRALIWPSS